MSSADSADSDLRLAPRPCRLARTCPCHGRCSLALAVTMLRSLSHPRSPNHFPAASQSLVGSTSPVCDVSNIFFSALARRPIRRQHGQYAWGKLTPLPSMLRNLNSTTTPSHSWAFPKPASAFVFEAKQTESLISRDDTIVIQATRNVEGARVRHSTHFLLSCTQAPLRVFLPRKDAHIIHAEYIPTIYTLVPAEGARRFVQIRNPSESPPPSWGVDACRLH